MNARLAGGRRIGPAALVSVARLQSLSQPVQLVDDRIALSIELKPTARAGPATPQHLID